MHYALEDLVSFIDSRRRASTTDKKRFAAAAAAGEARVGHRAAGPKARGAVRGRAQVQKTNPFPKRPVLGSADAVHADRGADDVGASARRPLWPDVSAWRPNIPDVAPSNLAQVPAAHSRAKDAEERQ